jgi:glycosyltransferase involved in cell wall biosynthesis
VVDVDSAPLVSIGVPTFNRAGLLERALCSLMAQDYPNIEIIVSDNASTDDTSRACACLQREFPLLRYHRMPVGVPVVQNFRNALLLSTGPYFMWAADDDQWDRSFVSTLVGILESEQDVVLAAAEAQYQLVDGQRLPYFPEGKRWYKRASGGSLGGVLRAVWGNYGNLIYGIYRRDALVRGSDTVLDACKFINEIPVFVQVAARGHILVCDQVLWYKTVPYATFVHAAREYGVRYRHNYEVSRADDGGNTSSTAGLWGILSGVCSSGWSRLKGIARWGWRAYNVTRYHAMTLLDVGRAVCRAEISPAWRVLVMLVFWLRLVTHLWKLVVVWEIQDAWERGARAVP